MNEFCHRLINLMNEYNVRLDRYVDFVYLDTQLIAATMSYDDFDGSDNAFYNFKYVEDDAVQCRKFYL